MFHDKGAILVKHVSQRSPFLKLFQSVMCICEVWNGGLQSIPHNRPWLHRTSYLYAHPHWYKNRQQYKYKRQRWKKNYNNTNTRASLMDTYSWGKRRTACLTCCFFFRPLLANSFTFSSHWFPLSSCSLTCGPHLKHHLLLKVERGEEADGLIGWQLLENGSEHPRSPPSDGRPWLGKHLAE